MSPRGALRTGERWAGPVEEAAGRAVGSDGGHTADDLPEPCAPAWDGEDDLFDVRSLNDLVLLPSLMRVTTVDCGTLIAPDKGEILPARGIEAG